MYVSVISLLFCAYRCGSVCSVYAWLALAISSWVDHDIPDCLDLVVHATASHRIVIRSGRLVHAVHVCSNASLLQLQVHLGPMLFWCRAKFLQHALKPKKYAEQ